MLERERALRTARRRASRSAPRAPTSQYASTKPPIRSSSSSVTVRVPRAHDSHVGRARVRAGRRARAGGAPRRRSRSPAARRRRPGSVPRSSRRPGDALGVVAVRAALEQRERRVREPPHLCSGGSRQRHAARAGGSRAARRVATGSSANSASCARLVARRPASSRQSGGLGAVVDAQHEARVAALELDRLGGARSTSPRAEPLEHPADRRLAVARASPGRSRPTRSAGRSRASSRRSRGAAARRLVLALLGLAHRPRTRRRRSLLPDVGSTTRKPKRAVGARRGSRRPTARLPVSRPASATITTLNSSPFAAWIVSSRTASAPSSSETASSCAAPTASWSRMNRTKPSMSGPRSSSYERASRISLRRFA